MPRVLRGEALANAIYQATDKLEEQFAEIFIAEVRKLSRSKALQELLDQVEAGAIAGSGVTSRLNIISVPVNKLDELIRKAMGTAIRITNEKTGIKLSFDYRNPDVIQAARTMSIDLSTQLTKTARQILEKTIGDAIEGIITRNQAVQIIQSRVGLIPAHADAVERYYEKLIADGKKKVDAKRLADKYADRLLRYRANTIARTEIARATGIGQGEFWKQAVADGLLPPKTKRVWITAADERVCEICGPMDGLQTEIGQPWMTQNGLVQYPSAAHPNCRCTQGIALTKDYLRMFREEIAERQDTIDELQKLDSLTIDKWLFSKSNPYHDASGKFTSADKAVAPKGGKPKLKRGGAGKVKPLSEHHTVKVEPFSPRKISSSALVRYIPASAKYPYEEEEVEGTLWEHQSEIDNLGDAEPYPIGHKMTAHQKDCVDLISYAWINNFERGKYIRAKATWLVENGEVENYSFHQQPKDTVIGDDILVATTIQAIREAPKSVVWRGLRLTEEAASKLVKGAIHEESIATGTGRKALAVQFTFGRWMNPEEARSKPVQVLLKIKARNVPIGESPVNTPKQVKSLVDNLLFGAGDTQPLVAFADERFISGRYKITNNPTKNFDGLLVVEMEEVG